MCGGIEVYFLSICVCVCVRARALTRLCVSAGLYVRVIYVRVFACLNNTPCIYAVIRFVLISHKYFITIIYLDDRMVCDVIVYLGEGNITHLIVLDTTVTMVTKVGLIKFFF